MASGALRWFLTRETLSQKNPAGKMIQSKYKAGNQVAALIRFLTPRYFGVCVLDTTISTLSHLLWVFKNKEIGSKVSSNQICWSSLRLYGTKAWIISFRQSKRFSFSFLYNLSLGIGWEGWSRVGRGGTVRHCITLYYDVQLYYCIRRGEQLDTV